MSNLYNNEIIFNGQTLMSLKEDTVTPDKVLAGETFHDRSGAPQQGSMITHNVYNGLDSTSTDDALSANMGKVLNSNMEKCLNFFSIGQVTASTPITLSVSSGTIAGILVGVSNTSARHVLAFVMFRSSSYVYSVTISSQNVTVTANDNSIVITSDNYYGAPLYLIPFNQNHIDNLVIT